MIESWGGGVKMYNISPCHDMWLQLVHPPYSKAGSNIWIQTFLGANRDPVCSSLTRSLSLSVRQSLTQKSGV